MSLLAANGFAIRKASGLSIQYTGYDGDPSLGAIHEEQWAVDRQQDITYVFPLAANAKPR